MKALNVKGTSYLRDSDIRGELSRQLLSKLELQANTLIVEEFGCNTARADLAVISDIMHCFEIKSGRDKLDRLANQIPAYSAVFDQVTLVTERIHIRKARAAVPVWWGLIEVTQSKGSLHLTEIRKCRKNRAQCKKQLAKMLWRDEAYGLLKKHGRHEGLRVAPVRDLWQAIEGLPLVTISAGVRSAIMLRGGSGFRPPLMQNDGSYPTGSKFEGCPARSD